MFKTIALSFLSIITFNIHNLQAEPNLSPPPQIREVQDIKELTSALSKSSKQVNGYDVFEKFAKDTTVVASAEFKIYRAGKEITTEYTIVANTKNANVIHILTLSNTVKGCKAEFKEGSFLPGGVIKVAGNPKTLRYLNTLVNLSTGTSGKDLKEFYSHVDKVSKVEAKGLPNDGVQYDLQGFGKNTIGGAELRITANNKDEVTGSRLVLLR